MSVFEKIDTRLGIIKDQVSAIEGLLEDLNLSKQIMEELIEIRKLLPRVNK